MVDKISYKPHKLIFCFSSKAERSQEGDFDTEHTLHISKWDFTLVLFKQTEEKTHSKSSRVANRPDFLQL